MTSFLLTPKLCVEVTMPTNNTRPAIPPLVVLFLLAREHTLVQHTAPRTTIDLRRMRRRKANHAKEKRQHAFEMKRKQVVRAPPPESSLERTNKRHSNQSSDILLDTVHVRTFSAVPPRAQIYRQNCGPVVHCSDSCDDGVSLVERFIVKYFDTHTSSYRRTDSFGYPTICWYIFCST